MEAGVKCEVIICALVLDVKSLCVFLFCRSRLQTRPPSLVYQRT